MPSLPHSLLLPLCPQAVSAPSFPFSEGHSLILVSINADPVTHWPERFSSDIGTQKAVPGRLCARGSVAKVKDQGGGRGDGTHRGGGVVVGGVRMYVCVGGACLKPMQGDLIISIDTLQHAPLELIAYVAHLQVNQ